MNQERSLAIFMRMARVVVGKQVTTFHKELAGCGTYASYNEAAQLMNSMQLINHSLVSIAIKLIQKAKSYQNVDTEKLVADCKNVISGSIADYMKRV